MSIKPYSSIGDFYKKKFGEKVYKISVSVADTCPNRMGLKGMQTCTFCDVWGSSAYPEVRDQNLDQQISELLQKIKTRYHANKFLIYFQSYTSTFLSVKKLEMYYNTALENPAIVGIVVGTRPDCISPSLLKLWRELSEKTYLSVELGVQTFNDTFLQFLKRGHDAQASRAAILKIYEFTGVDIGLHYILGNPSETQEDIVDLARTSNMLPIQNVKLHNLHVLKNTELEKLYNSGVFTPLDLETYTNRVILFLEHLRPEIAVQRLSAVSSRWDELIAPEWTSKKMMVTQYILDELKKRATCQGKSRVIG